MKIIKNKKGFTLVELLIAMAILIIGLVGVVTTIPVAQRIVAKSDLKTRASISASKVMENLKSEGYLALSTTSNWSGTEDGFNWQATVSKVGASEFQGAITLPADGLLKIEVILTYISRGKSREEKVVTFYSEI